jgi:hypothetical protein
VAPRGDRSLILGVDKLGSDRDHARRREGNWGELKVREIVPEIDPRFYFRELPRLYHALFEECAQQKE